MLSFCALRARMLHYKDVLQFCVCVATSIKQLYSSHQIRQACVTHQIAAHSNPAMDSLDDMYHQ